MLDYPRSLLRLSSSHVAVLLSLSAALAACSSDTKAGGGSDASAGGATGTGGSASGGKGGSATGTGGSASGTGGSASGTGGATGTGGSAASTGGTTGTDGSASGGSSGACAFGGACGGALVGTWDITDICPPKVPEAIGICPTDPDSTLTLLGGTGVLTVTCPPGYPTCPGASYTLDITATLNAVYSAACLAPTQMKVCTDVEVQLVKSFGGTAVCTGSRTTSCDCIMHMPQKTDTGTIVIAGNTVKLVNQGSTEAATTAQNFCVKGTALELEKTTTATSDAGAAKTSTTVFKATKK